MRLPHDERVRIVTLSEEGLSSAELAERFGVRKATILALLAKYRRTGSVDDLRGRGRPRLSTDRQDRTLARLALRTPLMRSRALRQTWDEVYGVQASSRTVRRRLNEANIYTIIAPKKPLLTPAHRQQRLQWAHDHANWTVDDWKRVVFSDECQVQLIQSSQRRYVSRRRGIANQPDVVRPRVPFGGGSLMLWGAITADRVFPLHRVVGTLTTDIYINILAQYIRPFFENHPNWTLQQDNAPCHKSRRSMKWFANNNITVMRWPPNSPDLNIIEHLWSYLKRRLDTNVVHGLDQLWEASRDIFHDVDMAEIEHLYDSMPNRCQEVIRRNGGNTHY